MSCCNRRTSCLWLSGFFGALALVNLIQTFIGAPASVAENFISFAILLLVSIAFWVCASMEEKQATVARAKPRRR